MQAVELMVFLTVAIITGFFVIGFLQGTDFKLAYSNMFGEKEPEFRKVDIEGFVSDAITFWDNCGMGEVNNTLRLYVNDDTELNKSVIFDLVKQVDLCNTLQSAEYECGHGEHIDMPASIILPRVITLRCDPGTQRLVITA